jgi:hypothetical protein
MENDFINNLDFINPFDRVVSVQNGSSKGWKHVFVALFGNWVLDADAINHLPLWRDYRRSLDLGLFTILKVDKGPGITLVWDDVLAERELSKG